jgi:signal transduction histidine kinase
MEKRCDGISKIIIKYIIIVFTLMVTSLGLLAVISLIIFSKKDLKPANYVEQKVEEWIDSCKEKGSIEIESFPEDADYVWKANDGKMIGSSADADNNNGLKKFMERYEKHQIGQEIKGHNVYMTVTDDDSVLFIHYIIGYRYEYIFLIIVVLVLMIDILIPTVLLIKRIKRAILKVSEYTLAIGNDDLSTNSEKTDIKELNNIIAAVDEMKAGLVTILNERWEEQQEQKRQMAMIAHDLKTPLTIIRGNADLLLENENDEGKIESAQAIINNSERIVRSILEILEKEKQ